jgi:hypothetical protein
VAVFLGANPQDLEDAAPAPLPLTLLLLADTLRLVVASAFGLALARQVTSLRVALLISALAAASDIPSVLAGSTKALVEGGAPALG